MEMYARLEEIFRMYDMPLNGESTSFNHIVKHLVGNIYYYEGEELSLVSEEALEKYLNLLDVDEELKREHLTSDPFHEDYKTGEVIEYVDMLWEKRIYEADVFKD
ncbi:hypothetical protein CL618_01460 [archaeon]|nr:hypothetical protein [archaeon]|tara:strand:+ start:1923 stop:2237 length:315 start_codon:yes stop_codon:yes gene_type:complete